MLVATGVPVRVRFLLQALDLFLQVGDGYRMLLLLLWTWHCRLLMLLTLQLLYALLQACAPARQAKYASAL